MNDTQDLALFLSHELSARIGDDRGFVLVIQDREGFTTVVTDTNSARAKHMSEFAVLSFSHPDMLEKQPTPPTRERMQ